MRRSRALSPALKSIIKYASVILLLWTVLDVQRIARAVGKQAGQEPPSLGSERILITSIHWNNEKILREDWIGTVVALAKQIGRDNVYVSVYESGSWDDTKGALRELNRQLAEADIPRRIVLDATTHQDSIDDKSTTEGRVRAPDGHEGLRRIPYLAALRNKALWPLYHGDADRPFDKVLFLNDVVFTTDDVRTLLATRDGHYAAACSLDFSNPPDFYDTFALRDQQGEAAIMQQWPYFRARRSRNALLESQPVPVRSCWNGIVAMDAAAFLGPSALQFRGVPDSLASYHVEASECCLIHADNPQSSDKGVWLNPNVRVGYNAAAYAYVHPEDRPWLSAWGITEGIWKNRFLRWFTTDRLRASAISRRVKQWHKTTGQPPAHDLWCMVDEMHLLAWNGWAHV